MKTALLTGILTSAEDVKAGDIILRPRVCDYKGDRGKEIEIEELLVVRITPQKIQIVASVGTYLNIYNDKGKPIIYTIKLQDKDAN